MTAFTDDSKRTNNKELEIKRDSFLQPKHRTDAQSVTAWKIKNAVGDRSLPALNSNSASSSHASRLENLDAFTSRSPPILKPDLKTPPTPVARARSSKAVSLDSRNTASPDIFNTPNHLNCSSHQRSIVTTSIVESNEIKSKMDASKTSFTSGTNEKPIVQLRKPPLSRIAHPLPLTIMPPNAPNRPVSKVDQIENVDTPMHKPVPACTSIHESDLEDTCRPYSEMALSAMPASLSAQNPGPAAQTSDVTHVLCVSVKDKMKLFNC